MFLPLHRKTLSLAAVAICASASLAGVASPAEAAVSCDKVASLSGSDSNPGTLSQPYRTTAKLTYNLSAGQTGCYRGGEFRHAGTINLTRAGTAEAPIRIRSYPGERATIHGRLVLKGAHTVLEYLNLRDSIESGETHSPSPQILADYVAIQHNDISNNHTAICAAVSTQSSTIRPKGWKFNHNRVHDCGRLPATNKDHGLYVSQSLGGEVAYNLFYDNADRGVQFYPNADNNRVHHNVITDNGQGLIFGGATLLSDGKAGGQSDYNVVENNVITHSRIRDNIEASWGGGVQGRGNVARDNCVWKADGSSGINTSNGGFTATANTVTEPRFVGRSVEDYRLSSDSPCLAILGTSTVGPLAEGTSIEGTDTASPAPVATPTPAPIASPTPNPTAPSSSTTTPTGSGAANRVAGSSAASVPPSRVVTRVRAKRQARKALDRQSSSFRKAGRHSINCRANATRTVQSCLVSWKAGRKRYGARVRVSRGASEYQVTTRIRPTRWSQA